jgi:hypothetical protein
MPDKFPEAFNRFEKTIDIRKINNYDELRLQFRAWALDKWIGSTGQNDALQKCAEKEGIRDTYRVERFSFRRKGRIVIASRNSVTKRFVIR